MKKFFLFGYLFIVAIMANAQLTPEQEVLYKKILDIRVKKLNALIKSNHQDLDKHYDSNVLIIRGHRDEKFNKNQFQQAIADKKFSYDTIYDLSSEAHFFNENKICIITGEVKFFYKTPNKKIIITKFTDMYYLNKHGDWKNMYFHSQKSEN